jgi:hypothetical protein
MTNFVSKAVAVAATVVHCAAQVVSIAVLLLEAKEPPRSSERVCRVCRTLWVG